MMIHVIAGATATGKSAHALSLAEQIDGVIINADSQQVYSSLPILTARPGAEEEARVPHRLYGFLGDDEFFSVGKWLRLAKMEIDWTLGNGKTPIIVGGTGLYLKVLMQGIAEIPAIDDYVRKQAESDYTQMGKEEFAARLRDIDPEFFARLTVYDRQRLIRAYAVWLGSGKTLSYWQKQDTKPAYDPALFRLEIITMPRQQLYARCDARVMQMIKNGALQEVAGYNNKPSENIEKIIGFRELSAHLKGEMTLNEAIAKMQQTTRNYAKRQVTWFKNQL